MAESDFLTARVRAFLAASQEQKIVLAIIATMVVFSHVFLLWAYPQLQPLIVVSAVALLGFQWVAIEDRPKRIFRYTDHVYYLLISGAIGVGSIFVTDSQSFADFTKLLQAKRLRTELADIAAVLRTTAKYEESRSEEAVAKCPKPERIAGETQVNAVMRNTLGKGCDAILAGEQLLAERPGREARSRDIAAQLAEVTQSGEPSVWKFYWAPTALLLGVAMKLGKALLWGK